MNKLVLSTIWMVLLLSNYAKAMNMNENDSIKKVIEQLFDSMRNADKAKAEAVFRPEALLQTVYVTKDGITVVKEESLKEFIETVGTPRNDIWDERIQTYEIHSDGLIATVWTPYKFYINNEFSHCGNNAFVLVKTQHGWKISSIIDTRRKSNCD